MKINVGKGEIHLIFNIFFLHSNSVFDPFPNKPWFSHIYSTSLLKTLSVGKGEIARNEQFLLFPQCFVTLLENPVPFSLILKSSSANSFSLELSKICHFGKC